MIIKKFASKLDISELKKIIYTSNLITAILRIFFCSTKQKYKRGFVVVGSS